jgi:soluble lytic murein transglycosylase
LRVVPRLISVTVVVAFAGVSSASATESEISSIDSDREGRSSLVGEGLSQTWHAHDPAVFWLAPASSSGKSGNASFARVSAAASLLRAGKYSEASRLLTSNRPVEKSVASYHTFFLAHAQLKLDKPEVARRYFAALAAQRPAGYLLEAAMLGEAVSATATGDHAGAQRIYERLAASNPLRPDHVWMQLGRSARAAGDRESAVAAFARVYEQFPASVLVSDAVSALMAMNAIEPIAPRNERYRLEYQRAEALFEAKRYDEATATYEKLLPHATAADRERLEVRRALSLYSVRHYVAARAALNARRNDSVVSPEAQFVDSMAARMLGDHTGFERAALKLVETFPDSAWAEEALNTLATHFIQQDRDEDADAVFRRLLTTFPTGRFAPRAAWKVGWRALRAGGISEAADLFEATAATFPGSTCRPAYLYWAARARYALGGSQAAADLYETVDADYRYSYYGRLAQAALHRDGLPVRVSLTSGAQVVRPQAPPPTAALIRGLLSAGLYDDAVNEIRYAQHRWGESPALEATLGWIEHQRGDLVAGARAVKRAYPEYVSAVGESLPRDLSTVIFPLGYWSLIREQATRLSLDPYVLAALVAQESGFVPDIRSPAKAVGLMQLVPGTAQRYARKLALPSYSPAHLVRPETNVRLGTAYFADLMREFGDIHLALASYNAGENRVRRWLAERPGLAPDEFVDDIPFPETQEYVKRILGTAEDYRRIYDGNWATASNANRAVPSLASRRSAIQTASRIEAPPKAEATKNGKRTAAATPTKAPPKTAPSRPASSKPSRRAQGK